MSSEDSNHSLAPAAFTPPQTVETKPNASDVAPDEQPLSAIAFEPLSGQTAQRTLPPWPWLAGGVALVALLFCMLFLLTARSLELRVNAIGTATIDIEGLAVKVGNRYLIRPGEYLVSVDVEGYRDWRQIISVTEADSQQIDIEPAILPGTVSITSVPPEAHVILNGEDLGLTPIHDMTLAAGSHSLQITAPRYRKSEQTVAVTGRGVDQTIAVTLAPDWADITLASEPAGADVYIDDTLLGTTNNRVEVPSGEHTLSLKRAGYQDYTLELSVVAGVAQQPETITLVPANGVLALRSNPSGASVTVDGEFVGRTPQEIELSPGADHLIRLSKLGYTRQSVVMTLDKGAFVERSITLQPELGDIVLTLAPEDAEIIIDGESLGRGSQTLSLAAFERRLEVRKPGYATQRQRITPRPGLAQRVTVTLLTEAEARKAALTPEITTSLGQTLVLIDPMSAVTNEFTMGATRREPGRRSNEVEHTVRLERAFYLATTETTNAQFRRFLANHDSGQIEGNSLNREHQPVVQVSWQQAARFCNWLSEQEGLAPFYRDTQGIINGYNSSSTGYRLPSEAEWAYAARIEGERYRRFGWGDTFPPQKAVVNVADNTSALVTGRILNGYADGHIVSAPVATFPPNHRGLYDMDGNVAEWVNDVYTIPSANAEVSVDPLGARNGDNYTVRGASWGLSRLSELRLTYRDYGAAGRDDLGFRVARYAE